VQQFLPFSFPIFVFVSFYSLIFSLFGHNHKSQSCQTCIKSYSIALPWLCRQTGPFLLLSKKGTGLKYSLGVCPAVVSSASVPVYLSLSQKVTPTKEGSTLSFNPVTKSFRLLQLHPTQLSCHAFTQPIDSDLTSTAHSPSCKKLPWEQAQISASAQAVRNCICTPSELAALPQKTLFVKSWDETPANIMKTKHEANVQKATKSMIQMKHK